MRQALFPLHTVLFPGSRLPLQIFEQRYLNLVTACLREEHGFVTVLISEGKEVGDQPKIYNFGCYVEIIDWDTLDNGLLGITIEARHRVRLSHPGVKDDGLLLAKSEPVDKIDGTTENFIPLPDKFNHLADTLAQLLQHPHAAQYSAAINFKSASDVCYRLGELLPISNERKQFLLEVPSIEELLAQIHLQIQQLQH